MGWHHLPVELRTEILSVLIHDDWFRPYPPHAECLQLRLVCREFNNIFSSIIFLRSDHFTKMRTKPSNGVTVAWLLSIKARLDPPDYDVTSTYLQHWAAFMAAQSTWQVECPDNYDQWLQAACRAAVYQDSPNFPCASLVCSPHFVGTLVDEVDDLAVPGTLTAIQASTGSGDLSCLKTAHGALHIACERGNLEAVKSLLSCGNLPAARHLVFGYPVYCAVRNGHLEIVKSLFNYGTKLHPRKDLVESLLELAARRGNLAVFRYLLEKSPGHDAASLQYLFFLACQQGHESIVKLLFQWVDEKAKLHKRSRSWVNRMMLRRSTNKLMALNPDQQMGGGQTPLCLAVRNKHAGIVKFLVFRPEFSPGDQTGSTCPLFVAAQTDQGELAKLLLELYQFYNKVTPQKLMTLLIEACRLGSRSVVKLLLEQPGVDPNSRANATDSTPLVTAIEQATRDNSPNHLCIVKLLLQNHMLDANLPKVGLKPLEVAIERNNAAMVELLLDHPNTDPNLHNDQFTPLCNAVRNMNLKIVQLLLKRPNTDPNMRSKDMFWGTPLVTAVGRAYTPIVKELLERSDIDPNLPSFDFRPSGNPLFYAAGSGNHEVTKLLLKRVDIDVNAATDNKVTPLVHAIINNKIGIVKLLLGHQNIDPNFAPEMRMRTGQHLWVSGQCKYAFNASNTSPIKSGVKQIPLLVAGTKSNWEVFELLLGHPKIDIHVTDSTGRTPLWWAATGGPEIITRLLLDKNAGISINKQDMQGWTPLHVAANRQSLQVVDQLLDHPDIDPNLANQNGCTALHISAFYNDLYTAERLLNHPKIDQNLETNDGKTALTIALALRHHRLARLLGANEQ